MPAARSERRILAVVALYQQAPEASHAFSSLRTLFEDDPEIARHFSLMVYDNSPDRQEIAAAFPLHYVHNRANSGLAGAYNCALASAEQMGCEWLLLLDQDTTLSRQFLLELLACATIAQTLESVAAIVPKLVVQGRIQSPAEPFIHYIRHQFTRTLKTFDQETGVHPGPVSAYNSGATLSVPRLRSIGGFPSEFWLDYLDHAVFHALCSRGGRVYMLQSVLQHDLAESDLNARPLWRFRNVLRAQLLFVKQVGSFRDRLLYRLWLLRSIRRLRADCHDTRIWRETALQALFFKAPTVTAPVPPPATQYTPEGS